MIFNSNNKIRVLPINYINIKETFKLARRIEENNIALPLNLLNNWNLLSILDFNSYKLTSNYIHLICKEPFDEN